MLKIDRFENNSRITKEILSLVEQKGYSKILETIVEYSEERALEIDFVADVVKSNEYLTSLLQEEAEKLNLMKTKISRLPI